MTLFICGNSHTRALRSGASLLEQEGAAPMVVFPLGTADNEAQAFSTIENGRVVLTNMKFRNKLRKNFGIETFEPEHNWGICLGTHNARIFRDEGWLSAAPAWLNLPGMTPISAALFAQIVSDDQIHIRNFLDQLLTTGVRPFVISAPWPLRTHPAITETGIRPEIVAAIDAQARALFADWLHEREIPLVTPPPGTADDGGFLRSKFAKGRGDPHHGNQRYGKIMMQKVLDEQWATDRCNALASDSRTHQERIPAPQTGRRKLSQGA